MALTCCAITGEQADDRVRLFTSQGSGNFVEVDAAEIASVDMVPDPPAALCPARGGAPEPKLTNADVHQLIAQAGAVIIWTWICWRAWCGRKAAAISLR